MYCSREWSESAQVWAALSSKEQIKSSTRIKLGLFFFSFLIFVLVAHAPLVRAPWIFRRRKNWVDVLTNLGHNYHNVSTLDHVYIFFLYILKLHLSTRWRSSWTFRMFTHKILCCQISKLLNIFEHRFIIRDITHTRTHKKKCVHTDFFLPKHVETMAYTLYGFWIPMMQGKLRF